jgi:hypothetical protein
LRTDIWRLVGGRVDIRSDQHVRIQHIRFQHSQPDGFVSISDSNARHRGPEQHYTRIANARLNVWFAKHWVNSRSRKFKSGKFTFNTDSGRNRYSRRINRRTATVDGSPCSRDSSSEPEPSRSG